MLKYISIKIGPPRKTKLHIPRLPQLTCGNFTIHKFGRSTIDSIILKMRRDLIPYPYYIYARDAKQPPFGNRQGFVLDGIHSVRRDGWNYYFEFLDLMKYKRQGYTDLQILHHLLRLVHQWLGEQGNILPHLHVHEIHLCRLSRFGSSKAVDEYWADCLYPQIQIMEIPIYQGNKDKYETPEQLAMRSFREDGVYINFGTPTNLESIAFYNPASKPSCNRLQQDNYMKHELRLKGRPLVYALKDTKLESLIAHSRMAYNHSLTDIFDAGISKRGIQIM